MRIVLLCGGSGKRLWPLSNEIRSKVFLKLLKSADGTRESMIQRICRQLDEVGLLQSTCIITHHSQVEITRTYVGEDIPIISEPYKRGTFPAIGLAISYLHENMDVEPNETICILPVDTFADTAFFQLLHRFPDVLAQSKAALALLGTKPNQPSDQFGYIVPVLPKDPGGYAFIHQFREKPDEQTAGCLIEQMALWNCGIFAFSLQFMLTYLQEMGHPVQVDAWRAAYEHLANESFDREVVEHTQPAVVLAYEGLWNDLGSWKALTEHFNDRVIGTGRISDNSSNTHIINELPYPIEVIGVPDIIVAASADGILIANKEQANLIKERYTTVSLIPKYGEKSWGIYRVLHYCKDELGTETMIKQVELAQGKATSYHQHHLRQEIITILSGSAEILLEDIRYKLLAGDVLQIPAGMKHGIKAITPLIFMEVLLGRELTEEDITRLAHNW
ncbi:cupin domain-containing protein [Paenibacillus sp. HWE-109]|uniref:sugar phosphate nucleotidyltransferase n=1 Tax=Paenibacillus sp. HWE-109 TaxID=1306526 RepID=UPI001EE1017D|nr:sugar phosphate nucleotidyltransferase [Paenibacillus sp. HWE-109]UKS30981.1 cupin domain-containing protein [Paenibacillus sp. HWE-109]